MSKSGIVRNSICIMKVFILLTLAGIGLAGTVQKRFGVPLQVEDECNPSIGNATFAADPSNCQVFYICDHGWPKVTFCPADSIWSQTSRDEGRCDSPYVAVNDVCGHVRPLVDPAELGGPVDPAYSRCQYQCINSPECIAWWAKCDTIPHCSDGSDEIDCAAICDPQTCRLPNCRCSGTDIPGGLLPGEVPQMVLMTWESAVRLEDYNHLLQQLLKKVGRNRRREPRTNPNGCPISATFFIEHQFTDYAAVQDLYASGNEISLLSISKTIPADQYWKIASEQTWTAEFAGQRQIVSHLGRVNPSDIIGMRAPFLQVGGNQQFRMMKNNGFLYDNSMPSPRLSPPLWPYTLDYRSAQDCVILPCPTASFPGVWEVPMNDYLDTNDTLCAEVDNCYFPDSKEEALELLRSNFARHYQTNRAPFPLHLRARWFYEAHYNIEAMEEFLDELLSLNDVYVISIDKALEWIRNPSRLGNVGNSGLFSCDYRDREPLCSQPVTCSYYNITYPPNSVEHQGDRYIETCAQTCSPRYPWVDNPEGRI